MDLDIGQDVAGEILLKVAQSSLDLGRDGVETAKEVLKTLAVLNGGDAGQIDSIAKEVIKQDVERNGRISQTLVFSKSQPCPQESLCPLRPYFSCGK